MKQGSILPVRQYGHTKSAPMVAGRSSTYFEKSIIYWDPSTGQNEKDQL